MRTRNSDAGKSVTPKRTLPGRKSASKTPPDSAPDSTPSPMTGSDTKPDQSTVVEEKESADETSVTLEAKVPPPKKRIIKKVLRVVKKVVGKKKTPVAEKVLSMETPNLEESVDRKDEGRIKKEVIDAKDEVSMEEEVDAKDEGTTNEKEVDLKDFDSMKNVVEPASENVGEPDLENTTFELEKDDSSTAEIIGEDDMNEQNKMNVDLPPNEIVEASENHEPNDAEKVEEETKEDQTKAIVGEEENKIESVDAEKTSEHLQKEDAVLEYGGDEGYEEYADRVDLGDHGEDDFAEEDPEEINEEAEALEEEQKELTAVAKMRKINKEYEIFVGGLDKEATEEEVKKVFEKIGEVVEVRLHGDLSMNDSKRYAFVKYSNKEHVNRALSEMKNPVIRGKRCRTAPSEDNDTLFLGNICNTWTKEAIRQKLKDYGVEGVENITLVADVQHEGRSRGFAFLDFSCHVDAMHAYKRLQQPDVVFGHHERTAKVAFAEPIREPDPEIMAHVKTVFLDGLPPHWDEDRVRKILHGYGEIVRVVLARNMSTAKRKDFGFVDFSSHEAAVACIEKVNNTELSDGYSKTRIKARLSNPMPKTQAVKGGMCGGFLINRAGTETSSRFERGFGRGGRFNWGNFPRGRGFHQRGRGQPSRMGPSEYDFSNRYGTFHGRQTVGRGGGRGPLRGGYHPAGRGPATAGPSRSNFNRPWNDAPVRGYREHPSSRRHPFSPEEAFDRPYVRRQFHDPYFYDDGAHGMKRPFYMTDHDPDYLEPRRVQPRLDYSDPAVTFHGTHYHDTYGADRDHYSHGYYGPGYDGAYPPYYRNDRPYGDGYYY